MRSLLRNMVRTLPALGDHLGKQCDEEFRCWTGVACFGPAERLSVLVGSVQVCCVAITDGRANVPLAVSEGDQNALDWG